MPSVIASGFGTILLSVKSFLVAQLTLDAAQVKIVSRDKRRVPKFTGDKDVLLRPLNFISKQQDFDGGGRHTCRLKRWFDAFCRHRNFMDESQEDTSFLTDTSGSGQNDANLGFLEWEELVAATIAGHFPVDAGGNHLTCEEIRIWDGEQPDKDADVSEWGDSGVRFEVEYFLLLGSAPY